MGHPSGVVPVDGMSVSSDRVRPKKVMIGPVPMDGVAVGVGDCVALCVGVDVRMAVAVAVPGVFFVGDARSVAVGVDVADTRVNVDVGEAVADGGLDGVGVRDGVAVGVGVAVARGVVGTGEGFGVNVGGIGPEPTRTINCRSGPRLPPVSRSRTLSTVWLVGKDRVRVTKPQNCTCVPVPRKLVAPNASSVHAELGDVAAAKLHAKSLSALATVCEGPKSGGVTAGIPPLHTAVLPSPSGLLLSICRSGRRAGLLGAVLKVTVAGGKPLGPVAPSTTMLNPDPAKRK